MSDPVGSFSGLASGIQWRDMIDQIMKIETTRRLDPITTRKTTAQTRSDAWGTYGSLVSAFRDAASKLRDGSAFGAVTATASNSPATGRTLLSASASASATPGRYRVEVLDLARANKLSGNILAGASTALQLSGTFAVNGQKVAITGADTLNTVRDKINALNAGPTPSGVTATILSTGPAQQRLVLTSDTAGARGIELIDDAGGTLASLGLVDGTKALNLSSTGGSQTYHVSSATAAVATLMGVPMPTPSTITVGGKTISVDLTVDSLTSIAAKINAAGGTATVTSESVGGKTSYQLVTDGTAAVDPAATSAADSQRTLEVLGFVKTGRSAVTQVVTSQNTFGDAVTAATSTTATKLTDLTVAGTAVGIAANDTITIAGTRGDGSTVSATLTVGATDTLQTLLTKLNDPATGFGAGSRPATASLVNGQIVLTDGKGGDSQLALSISVAKAGGGTLSLGRMNVSTVGREREVVAGSDAKLRVDGVVVTRPTNAVADVLTGVTLNLTQAEPGTTVDVTVARDADGIAKSVDALAKAYNDVLKFVEDQRKSSAPLYNVGALRASFSTLTQSLLRPVVGTTGSYTQSALAGLSLQKDGTLALDQAKFTAALATNFVDLQRLFTSGGTSANAVLSYVYASPNAKPGTYGVTVTQAATIASTTGAGFSGTYADDGTADTMTVSDAVSGASGSISLANGDTIDTIVSKLNALFGNNRMALTASKVGNDLKISGTRYGAAAAFTVGYTAGGTSGTAQLGLAAGTYAGLDVAGSFSYVDANGVTQTAVATGRGQTLTGPAGTPVDGLALDYTGSATGSVGPFTYVAGVGGTLYNATDLLVRTGGTVQEQQDALKKSITSLSTRADTVQQALDRKRAALVAQFTAMEAAISRIQSQASSLTSFIASMNARQA